MKKIFYLFTIISVSLASCTGDEGPQGPEGPPGINILGQTFGDLTPRDFSYDDEFNLYTHFLEIPQSVEVLDSDAILAYRLEVINGVETWNLIPKSIFLDNGNIIQYSLNHTSQDVELLITGNFDLSTLEDEFTQDQYFKFIVIPSDYVNESAIDFSNYQEVMEALDL